jgi:hypothetical protein
MTGVRTLFVTWQAQPSRRIFPIARLMALPSGQFEFAYVEAVREAQAQGFVGLPGFEQLDAVHVSDTLPALFAERAAPRGRTAARTEGPQPANDHLDASPLTVLVARADGSGNDRLEIFAPPLRSGEGYWGVFAARGVNQAQGAPELIERLEPGEELTVNREPHNPVNPRALALARRDGAAIGYVPDYFASELAALGASAEDFAVSVARVSRINFAPAAPIYEVLCRYSCGPRVGTGLFHSQRYQPLGGAAARAL